jgi:hypothetical protein
MKYALTVFLSVNPTLGKGPEPHGGPARPDVLRFSATEPSAAPVPLVPLWKGEPAFSEHSYRTFAANGAAGELLLFQNRLHARRIDLLGPNRQLERSRSDPVALGCRVRQTRTHPRLLSELRRIQKWPGSASRKIPKTAINTWS